MPGLVLALWAARAAVGLLAAPLVVVRFPVARRSRGSLSVMLASIRVAET